MELDTTLPFTRRDALAAGITHHALVSGRYRLLLRGVYISPDAVVDGYVTARETLLAAHRSAFVSHHTAAGLYRAAVPHADRVHVSSPRGTSRSDRGDGLVHSSARVPTVSRGQRVTTPADTFLDLAAHLNLHDLVVLGDSLVRRGRTTPEALVAAAGDRATRTAVEYDGRHHVERLARIFRQRGLPIGRRSQERRRYFPGRA